MIHIAHDIDVAVRKSIKVWMRETLEQRGWTASDWARKAGTTPTNITRFLDPTSRIVPRADTIFKLASVAGTQPQLVRPGRH